MKNIYFLSLILMGVILPLTLARLEYMYTIPNGDKIPCPPTNDGTCTEDGICRSAGHFNTTVNLPNCNGTAPNRDAFGNGLADDIYAWSVDFCRTDSDNDGFYNGLELGDPCCAWKKNTVPQRTLKTLLSHPGAADASVAGLLSCFDTAPVTPDPLTPRNIRPTSLVLNVPLASSTFSPSVSCFCGFDLLVSYENGTLASEERVIFDGAIPSTLSIFGLEPNSSYKVSYRTFNYNVGGAKESTFATEIAVTTTVGSVPARPLAPTVEYAGFEATIKWAFPLEVGGYNVTNCTLEFQGTEIFTGNDTELEYRITELRKASTYRARVKCTNEVGTGPYSPYIYFSTEINPGTRLTPSIYGIFTLILLAVSFFYSSEGYHRNRKADVTDVKSA